MTQIDIGDFTDEQAMRLQEFLASPERPGGTMSYFHLAGFMFALACAPEPVMPSEWMPLVFNDGEAVYEDMVEARAILGALMSLNNRINEEVREEQAQLPPGCLVLERASANLEAAAPLSQWATGFMDGHTWLQEMWDQWTPDSADEELGAVLLILCFFGNRKMAEELRREMLPKCESLDEAAELALRLLPDAMHSYAQLGVLIQKALIDSGYFEHAHGRAGTTGTAPGRNEPCPCGSGKKFKRCCDSG
jgi:uncharacterized protein